MLGINVRLWSVVASLGVVAVAAGATLGVLTLLGVTFQGESEPQISDGSTLSESPLLTANRDRFAICIDTDGVQSTVQDLAKTSFETAFAHAESDPSWARAGLDIGSPRVEVGCPAGSTVFEPAARLTSGTFGLIALNTPVVDVASIYRVFVFVVSEQVLMDTFGDGYPLATQEYLAISRDERSPVTMGLYVTPGELEDPIYLAEWLLVLGNAVNVSTIEGSGAQISGGSELTDTALLTANRDRLRLCVDRVDTAVMDVSQDKTWLEDAVSKAATHQFWAPSGLADVSPEVDIGCPSAPAVFDPDAYITDWGFGLFVEGTTTVERASPYRVFVFVVSEQTLSATFGKAHPIATQEILALSRDDFTPVTLGLYVTPDQLQDIDYLSQWILVTSGVLPASSVDVAQ